MAMSYHRIFKVPVWVILNKTTKAKTAAILDYFAERGGRVQAWPAQTYPEAVRAYKNKGWAHKIPDEGRFVLDTQLLLVSAAAHVKNVLGPTSYLGGSVTMPTDRLNRTVNSDADLETIFNDLLSLEDPIALSQVFQVAERCHNEDSRRTTKLWVTEGPAPKNLLTRISENVITIGDDDSNDLVTKEVSKDNLEDFLNENFAKFGQNI